MRRVLITVCFACISISALFAARQRQETILGQAVAYSVFPVCTNGNWYWSMVIHVERPKDIRSTFIRVDFSLPCDKSPEWVSAKPSVQKFHLYRQKDCDGVLQQFMNVEPKQSIDTPNWKHPPGTENESLPFGQIVPCYHSIDLPLRPIL